MPEQITLFNPRDVPALGMRSFTDPTALKPGEVALLQNGRVSDRTLKARRGTSVTYASAIRTSGLFRGSANLTLNGTSYWFAAYWHVSDSDLRVYYSTDSGSTWTEATTAYRTSRFAEDVQNESSVAAHDVQFAQVYDRILQRDVAIIQNGIEPPRIFDPSAASGLTCVRHQTIPPPDSTSIQKVAVYGLPYNPWSCNGTSQNTTADSTAAEMTGSYSGSTTLDYFQIVIQGTSINSAETTKMTGFSAVDMSLARQLWLVCETDYDQSDDYGQEGHDAQSVPAILFRDERLATDDLKQGDGKTNGTKPEGLCGEDGFRFHFFARSLASLSSAWVLSPAANSSLAMPSKAESTLVSIRPCH